VKKRTSFFLLLAVFSIVACASVTASAQHKVKIALWGDSWKNLDNATSEIAHVLLYNITDWDFQIHTGDFTHDGGEDSWQTTLHYPGIDSVFVKGRFYLCTSNHDAPVSRVKANWDVHTSGVLPINSTDSTTHFYAVHKGNVDIVFCDGYFTPPTVMQSWLHNYLSTSDRSDWLIGVWHNVSYGDLTYKTSYLSTCQPWIDSLFHYGCRFILNGHAHLYLRTKPLLPDGTIGNGDGIVTIVNGTGGATWENPVKPNPKIVYSPSERSFPTVTFLTFEGRKVHVETVDCRPGKNLEVIDECDYEK